MLFDDVDVGACPRELVALGGVLDVPTLAAAYRNGVFPWPASAGDAASHDRAMRRLARRGAVPVLDGTPPGPLVPWVSPQPRALLLPAQLSVPRTVRQLLRRTGWETTMDQAFAQVLARCADRTEGTWITDAMQAGYAELHRAGVAHSLEVWDGERLVGGLYGVQCGQVFSGESMFFLESGASKVAVVDLCARLDEAGGRILDTQQESEHLLAMGQVVADRGEYLAAVRSLRDRPAPLAVARRPVSRLA